MDNLVDRIRTAQIRASENEILKHLNEIGLSAPEKSAGVGNLSNVVGQLPSDKEYSHQNMIDFALFWETWNGKDDISKCWNDWSVRQSAYGVSEVTDRKFERSNKMNPINYATLEQSKRLKELGYFQHKTDVRWVKFGNDWRLMPTVIFDENDYNSTDNGEPDWYAAPNAQEIELINLTVQTLTMIDMKTYNGFLNISNINYAQARADAWIWEMKMTKVIGGE